MHFRRKFIWILEIGLSYKYLLNLSDLLCYLRLVSHYLLFCLDDLSIGIIKVLKSHTIIALLPISPFTVVSVCLM